jgi:hypothetical protein
VFQEEDVQRLAAHFKVDLAKGGRKSHDVR